MITLFIDTNVLLSFYHLTSEDIEELKKLVALVKTNEIELIVPKQVENEFWRNRGAKIVDAMKKLKETKFNVSFPAFSKDYEEYIQLRKLLKESDRTHAELVKKITAHAEATTLKADEIVTGLFQKAKKPAFSNEHYYSAVMRSRLGTSRSRARWRARSPSTTSAIAAASRRLTPALLNWPSSRSSRWTISSGLSRFRLRIIRLAGSSVMATCTPSTVSYMRNTASN
jgi:predicted nucleic acid-binding protein